MAFNVTFDFSLGIIESTCKGFFTSEELRDAVDQSAALTKETSSERILMDMSDIKEFAVGILDILSLPESLFVEKGISKRSHIALVVPQLVKAREILKFFEDACFNRGWIVRSFENSQDATDWLMM